MKADAKKIVDKIIGISGIVFVLITLIKQLAGWDWGAWFEPIVLSLVGLALIMQGNWKLKLGKLTGKSLVHRISSVVGSFVLLTGIIAMPFVTGLTIPVISTFAIYIKLTGILWFIVEIFVPD